MVRNTITRHHYHCSYQEGQKDQDARKLSGEGSAAWLGGRAGARWQGYPMLAGNKGRLQEACQWVGCWPAYEHATGKWVMKLLLLPIFEATGPLDRLGDWREPSHNLLWLQQQPLLMPIMGHSRRSYPSSSKGRGSHFVGFLKDTDAEDIKFPCLRILNIQDISMSGHKSISINDGISKMA